MKLPGLSTEDKLECLQELGVIAVGLADAMCTGALADEVPTTDGGNCPFVDLSTPPANADAATADDAVCW